MNHVLEDRVRLKNFRVEKGGGWGTMQDWVGIYCVICYNTSESMTMKII